MLLRLQRALTSLVLVVAAGALPADARAQAADVATEAAADAEFWRSAERIGTVDAYRAYLKAFAQGRYADLARAAIAKRAAAAGGSSGGANGGSNGSSNGSAADMQDPAVVLAGTPTSGAITLMPGETYHGPGPMTVGYLGAKKQLVLPNGPWVLVSVADRNSAHANPVPLVSMVFAQFKAGQLQSLMSYLFNGRTVLSGIGWADAQTCHDTAPPRGGAKAVVAGGPGSPCGWTVRQQAEPKVSDTAWEAAPAVVARLGVQMPVPPLQFTRAWVTNRGDYLAIRRVDYAKGGDPAAVQAARLAWLNDYLPLMHLGIDKKIGATELEPGQTRLPSVRLALPD